MSGHDQGALSGSTSLRLPEPAPVSALSGDDPARVAVARCIEIAREVRDGFLSEQYAVGQPLSSLKERFACNQVAGAIENEFGIDTMEQCRLLGKPTPFERWRDRDAAPREREAVETEGQQPDPKGIAK